MLHVYIKFVILLGEKELLDDYNNSVMVILPMCIYESWIKNMDAVEFD